MKNASVMASKVLGLAAALSVLNTLASRLPYFAALSGSDTSGNPLALTLLVEVLILSGLVYPVSHSVLRGIRLFGAVLLAVFGLNVLLTQIEAVVFLSLSAADAVAISVHGAMRAALITLAVGLAFGQRAVRQGETGEAEEAAPRRLPWLGRLVLSAVSYTVLYFVAGMLVWPWVSEFYATQEISIRAGMVAPLQLVRGSLYVVCVWPLLRSIVDRRWRVCLSVAWLFPALAGVPDLLMPNAFLPGPVRLLHLVEIGWSNFIYGLLVSYLFWPVCRDPHPSRESSADSSDELVPEATA